MRVFYLFILILPVLAGLNSCSMKKNKNTDNPLLQEYKTPFGVPPFDKIKFEDYRPAFDEAMSMHKKEIDEIANSKEEPNFENTINAYDKSGESLGNVSAIFGNQLEAAKDSNLEKLADTIMPMLSSHNDDIKMNKKLFGRIKKVYDNLGNSKLDAEQKKLTEVIYIDFVRAGALLDDSKQKRLRDINSKLSSLELQFGNNVQNDNNAFELVIDKKEDLAGLPEGVIAAAAETAKGKGKDGRWIFTTDKPSMIPFLQYSGKRDLREKIYRAYFMRGDNDNANDNKKVITEIISLRKEKAALLGFNSYADFILDRNMAKTPAKAYDLLNQIFKAALPVAKAEAAEMQKLIDKEGGKFKLAPWDWWYYAEKVRKEKYDLDEEMLRPYFSLDNVREGIFLLSNKLYGLTFKKRTDIPVYHPEVEAYEVLNADGSHRAVLYLDFHPRDNKRGGAWCTGYRNQHYKDGKNVTPVVSIVCNFTRPTKDTPALLSVDEVETFFHEFGHALHGFFSDVKYNRLSGDVPRDFVELPSQIMEHWAMNPQMLKLYAKHYKTGEIIPDALIEKVEKSSYFNQGFATVEFAAAALLDMDYHTISDAKNIDVRKFETEAMNKIGLIPEILPRYRSTYFSHIFSGGYSAGYYSYMWSEVLDCDAFEAFEESGNIFNKDIAAKFRKEVLAPGGKEDAMKMYINFRGREPRIDGLLKNRGLK